MIFDKLFGGKKEEKKMNDVEKIKMAIDKKRVSSTNNINTNFNNNTNLNSLNNTVQPGLNTGVINTKETNNVLPNNTLKNANEVTAQQSIPKPQANQIIGQQLSPTPSNLPTNTVSANSNIIHPNNLTNNINTQTNNMQPINNQKNIVETSLNNPTIQQSQSIDLNNLSQELNKIEESLILNEPSKKNEEKESSLMFGEEHLENKKEEKEEEELFIRLDKYEEIVKTIKQIKEKINENELILERIINIKKEEDAKLNKWENELRSIYDKIKLIEENLKNVK